MSTNSAVRQSGTVTQRGSVSTLGLWVTGLSVSLLVVTTFIMLTMGLLIGFSASFGLPLVVTEVLAAPIVLITLWMAVWTCSRVIDVEKRLAKGAGGPPDPAMHLLKPWVTTNEGR